MIASSESAGVFTFDDLFTYVSDALLVAAGIDPDTEVDPDDFDDLRAAIRACSGRFELVAEFCDERDIDFEAVREILGDAGGGCDCEVLLNSAEQLDERQELPRKW